MVSCCVSIPTDPTTPPSIVMRLCDPLWSFSRVSGGVGVNGGVKLDQLGGVKPDHFL